MPDTLDIDAVLEQAEKKIAGPGSRAKGPSIDEILADAERRVDTRPSPAPQIDLSRPLVPTSVPTPSDADAGAEKPALPRIRPPFGSDAEFADLLAGAKANAPADVLYLPADPTVAYRRLGPAPVPGYVNVAPVGAPDQVGMLPEKWLDESFYGKGSDPQARQNPGIGEFVATKVRDVLGDDATERQRKGWSFAKGQVPEGKLTEVFPDATKRRLPYFSNKRMSDADAAALFGGLPGETPEEAAKAFVEAAKAWQEYRARRAISTRNYFKGAMRDRSIPTEEQVDAEFRKKFPDAERRLYAGVPKTPSPAGPRWDAQAGYDLGKRLPFLLHAAQQMKRAEAGGYEVPRLVEPDTRFAVPGERPVDPAKWPDLPFAPPTFAQRAVGLPKAALESGLLVTAPEFLVAPPAAGYGAEKGAEALGASPETARKVGRGAEIATALAAGGGRGALHAAERGLSPARGALTGVGTLAGITAGTEAGVKGAEALGIPPEIGEVLGFVVGGLVGAKGGDVAAKRVLGLDAKPGTALVPAEIPKEMIDSLGAKLVDIVKKTPGPEGEKYRNALHWWTGLDDAAKRRAFANYSTLSVEAPRATERAPNTQAAEDLAQRLRDRGIPFERTGNEFTAETGPAALRAEPDVGKLLRDLRQETAPRMPARGTPERARIDAGQPAAPKAPPPPAVGGPVGRGPVEATTRPGGVDAARSWFDAMSDAKRLAVLDRVPGDGQTAPARWADLGHDERAAVVRAHRASQAPQEGPRAPGPLMRTEPSADLLAEIARAEEAGDTVLASQLRSRLWRERQDVRAQARDAEDRRLAEEAAREFERLLGGSVRGAAGEAAAIEDAVRRPLTSGEAEAAAEVSPRRAAALKLRQAIAALPPESQATVKAWRKAKVPEHLIPDLVEMEGELAVLRGTLRQHPDDALLRARIDDVEAAQQRMLGTVGATPAEPTNAPVDAEAVSGPTSEPEPAAAAPAAPVEDADPVRVPEAQIRDAGDVEALNALIAKGLPQAVKSKAISRDEFLALRNLARERAKEIEPRDEEPPEQPQPAVPPKPSPAPASGAATTPPDEPVGAILSEPDPTTGSILRLPAATTQDGYVRAAERAIEKANPAELAKIREDVQRFYDDFEFLTEDARDALLAKIAARDGGTAEELPSAISRQQVGSLEAVRRKLGLGDEEVQTLLRDRFDVDQFADLDPSRYSDAVAALKEAGAAKRKATAGLDPVAELAVRHLAREDYAGQATVANIERILPRLRELLPPDRLVKVERDLARQKALGLRGLLDDADPSSEGFAHGLERADEATLRDALTRHTKGRRSEAIRQELARREEVPSETPPKTEAVERGGLPETMPRGPEGLRVAFEHGVANPGAASAPYPGPQGWTSNHTVAFQAGQDFANGRKPSGKRAKKITDAFGKEQPAAAPPVTEKPEPAPKPEPATRTAPPREADAAIAAPESIRDLASRADAGTSWTPERRAEQHIRDFESTLRDVRDQLQKAAETPEQRALAEAEFQSFKDGFTRRFGDWLAARGRVVSSAIAGPSKFPVERNQKRLDVEQRRMQEMQDFREKAVRAALAKIRDARTDEQVADDEFARLKKAVASTIGALKSIKAGESGDPALFRSSLAGKLRRSWGNGNVEAVKKALDLVNRLQAEHKVTVFSPRNSIWDLRHERAPEPATAEPGAEGEQVVLERGDVQVIRNFDEDRVQIVFPGKPAEAIRADLRAEGWNWSPSNGAWQRKLTENAVYSARRIVGKHFPEGEPAAPTETGTSSTAPESAAGEPAASAPAEDAAAKLDRGDTVYPDAPKGDRKFRPTVSVKVIPDSDAAHNLLYRVEVVFDGDRSVGPWNGTTKGAAVRYAERAIEQIEGGTFETAPFEDVPERPEEPSPAPQGENSPPQEAQERDEDLSALPIGTKAPRQLDAEGVEPVEMTTGGVVESSGVWLARRGDEPLTYADALKPGDLRFEKGVKRAFAVLKDGGKTIWTDGGVVAYGNPPKGSRSPASPAHREAAPKILKETKGAPAEMLAVVRLDGGDPVKRVVFRAQDGRIVETRADRVRAVLEAHPKVGWQIGQMLGAEEDSPVAIARAGGETVAVVAPLDEAKVEGRTNPAYFRQLRVEPAGPGEVPLGEVKRPRAPRKPKVSDVRGLPGWKAEAFPSIVESAGEPILRPGKALAKGSTERPSAFGEALREQMTRLMKDPDVRNNPVFTVEARPDAESLVANARKALAEAKRKWGDDKDGADAIQRAEKALLDAKDAAAKPITLRWKGGDTEYALHVEGLADIPGAEDLRPGDTIRLSRLWWETPAQFAKSTKGMGEVAPKLSGELFAEIAQPVRAKGRSVTLGSGLGGMGTMGFEPKATGNQKAEGHILAREMGLSDEEFADVAEMVTGGKRSMADMTEAEAATFIENLRYLKKTKSLQESIEETLERELDRLKKDRGPDYEQRVEELTEAIRLLKDPPEFVPPNPERVFEMGSDPSLPPIDNMLGAGPLFWGRNPLLLLDTKGGTVGRQWVHTLLSAARYEHDMLARLARTREAAVKRLSKEERRTLVDAMEAKPWAEPTDATREVATEMDDLNTAVFDARNWVAVHWLGEDAALPRANYFTHMSRRMAGYLARLGPEHPLVKEYNRFLEKRKANEPYDRDALRVFQIHDRVFTKSIVWDPILQKLRNFEKAADPRMSASLIRYLRRYVEALAGRPDVVTKILGGGIRDLSRTVGTVVAGERGAELAETYGPGVVSAAIHGVDRAATYGFLGFNVGMGLTDLGQSVYELLELSPREAAVGIGHLIRHPKASMGIMTRVGAMHEHLSRQREPGIRSRLAKTGQVAGSAVLFPLLGSEFVLRSWASVAHYLKWEKVGRERGLTGKDLEEFAANEALFSLSKTQFLYSKLGTPEMLRSGIAKMTFKFAQYPILLADLLWRSGAASAFAGAKVGTAIQPGIGTAAGAVVGSILSPEGFAKLFKSRWLRTRIRTMTRRQARYAVNHPIEGLRIPRELERETAEEWYRQTWEQWQRVPGATKSELTAMTRLLAAGLAAYALVEIWARLGAHYRGFDEESAVPSVPGATIDTFVRSLRRYEETNDWGEALSYLAPVIVRRILRAKEAGDRGFFVNRKGEPIVNAEGRIIEADTREIVFAILGIESVGAHGGWKWRSDAEERDFNLRAVRAYAESLFIAGIKENDPELKEKGARILRANGFFSKDARLEEFEDSVDSKLSRMVGGMDSRSRAAKAAQPLGSEEFDESELTGATPEDLRRVEGRIRYRLVLSRYAKRGATGESPMEELRRINREYGLGKGGRDLARDVVRIRKQAAEKEREPAGAGAR